MSQKKGYKGYIVAILLMIIITIITLFATGNVNLNNKNKITEENYKCPEGYILKDEKCKKDVYECPKGAILLSTGECMKSTITYTCPEGYELYTGTKCVNSNEAKYIYICPEGYNLYEKTKCKKGNEIIDAIKILKEEIIYKYTCPEGYNLYEKTKCKKGTEIIDATKTLDTGAEYEHTCPEGYELYNGTKCKNGNEIIDATKKIISDKKYTYVCPEGYELYERTKCKKDDNVINAVKKQKTENNNIKDAKENFKEENLEKEKITQVVDPTEKNKNFTVSNIKLISGRSSYSMSHDLNNERDNIMIKILPENVAATVTCSSSNDEVIKLAKNTYVINDSGLISVLGIGPGTATITCSTGNGKKGSLAITVCADDFYENGTCNG